MRDISQTLPGVGRCRLAAAILVAVMAVATVGGEATASPPGFSRKTADPVLDQAAEAAVSVTEELFTILGPEDARLYREIFRLQNSGKWRDADKRIARLSDDILMGHVMFQRYMHPRAYRSKYVELSGWMKKYADHPEANRVYRLAAKRRPKNYRWPRQPQRPTVNVRREDARPRDEPKNPPAPSFNRRHTRGMAYGQRRIRSWLRRGAPTRALRYLETKSVNRHFDAIGYDQSLAAIAAGFFHAGKDQKALENASAAVSRSGAAVPEGYWWGGLAAWRLGHYDIATQHFEALANSRAAGDWMVSAGAYWAARGYLVTRQPDRVVPMLRIAARRPVTFYGMLGQEALALQSGIDWSVPLASPNAVKQLLGVPAARRGLALLQIGQDRRGMAELKRIVRRLPPSLLDALLAASEERQMASLAYQVGIAIHRSQGHWHGAALFPLPGWTPTGGYNIDRALIFAYMRQESNFKTGARSRAGARGLMQLMPGTAGFISGRRFRGSQRNQLYDPELNISLGQKYIRHLLEREPGIDGNLFYAAAAYNGGPGNLRKWLRGMNHRDDPLMFMESIPRKETRDYVEFVMTNLWLYRDRLGQPHPSLVDVVAGGWPVYSALDPLDRQVATRPIADEEVIED